MPGPFILNTLVNPDVAPPIRDEQARWTDLDDLIPGELDPILLDTTEESKRVDLPAIGDLPDGADQQIIIHGAGDLLAEIRPAEGEAINLQIDTPLYTVGGERYILTPDETNGTWWASGDLGDASGAVGAV
jgi:hypothetical protein